MKLRGVNTSFRRTLRHLHAPDPPTLILLWVWTLAMAAVSAAVRAAIGTWPAEDARPFWEAAVACGSFCVWIGGCAATMRRHSRDAPVRSSMLARVRMGGFHAARRALIDGTVDFDRDAARECLRMAESQDARAERSGDERAALLAILERADVRSKRGADLIVRTIALLVRCDDAAVLRELERLGALQGRLEPQRRIAGAASAALAQIAGQRAQEADRSALVRPSLGPEPASELVRPAGATDAQSDNLLRAVGSAGGQGCAVTGAPARPIAGGKG